MSDTVEIAELKTRSGAVLAVRPVSSADEALLAEFFDRVSDEDRRFRFLTAHKHLTHEQLVPMIEVDHFRTESFVAFEREVSIIAARAMDGTVVCFDPAENVHRNGILHTSTVPAAISASTAAAARDGV